MKTIEERLWAKIDASGGCWEWRAVKTNGYGQFSVKGKYKQAHRVVWELLVGPIADGLQIDHLCRNRGCVNPDHLETVTPKVNYLRGESMQAHHARKTTCPRGHVYDWLRTRPDGKVSRNCRTCHKAQGAARRNAA